MSYKISEILYKLLLILVIADTAFYHTIVPSTFKEALHNFCLLSIVILVVSYFYFRGRKYSKKFLLFNVFMCFYALLAYLICGNTDIIISILLVMLAWKLNLEDLLKIIFSIRFIVFALVVSLSIVGVLDMGTIASTSAEKGVLFGYGHANTFAGSAGILIFLMFAINRYRIKSIHFVIAIITDIIVFYVSKSRTGLLLITSLIFMVLAIKYVKSFKKSILKFSVLVLPILVIIVFLLVICCSMGIFPHFIDFIDKFMNGRILLSSMNLKYYPVTIFGQKVDISLIAASNRYYALDNGYVYVLIHYGIVGLLLITIVQQRAIAQCVKKKEPVLCIICTLILVWMMYEGMMVSATSNFTLLFSTACIRDRLKNKELTI